MTPKRARIIAEGVVAGILGHLGIALTLMIADLAAGRWILFTPALLGSVLLEGARDVTQVSLRAEPVLAYSSIHLVVMIGFGLIASLLIHLSERRPILWLGTLFLFLFVAWHLTGAVLTLLGPVQGDLSPGWVLVASGVGAGAMAAYLWREHAGLVRRLRGERFA